MPNTAKKQYLKKKRQFLLTDIILLVMISELLINWKLNRYWQYRDVILISVCMKKRRNIAVWNILNCKMNRQ